MFKLRSSIVHSCSPSFFRFWFHPFRKTDWRGLCIHSRKWKPLFVTLKQLRLWKCQETQKKFDPNLKTYKKTLKETSSGWIRSHTTSSPWGSSARTPSDWSRGARSRTEKVTIAVHWITQKQCKL
jgi:hypothetical protein